MGTGTATLTGMSTERSAEAGTETLIVTGMDTYTLTGTKTQLATRDWTDMGKTQNQEFYAGQGTGSVAWQGAGTGMVAQAAEQGNEEAGWQALEQCVK